VDSNSEGNLFAEDSGATINTVHDKSWFDEETFNADTLRVKMANESKVKALGTGRVRAKTPEGKVLNFSALWMPTLPNILSTGKMIKAGYNYTGDSAGVTYRDKNGQQIKFTREPESGISFIKLTKAPRKRARSSSPTGKGGNEGTPDGGGGGSGKSDCGPANEVSKSSSNNNAVHPSKKSTNGRQIKNGDSVSSSCSSELVSSELTNATKTQREVMMSAVSATGNQNIIGAVSALQPRAVEKGLCSVTFSHDEFVQDLAIKISDLPYPRVQRNHALSMRASTHAVSMETQNSGQNVTDRTVSVSDSEGKDNHAVSVANHAVSVANHAVSVGDTVNTNDHAVSVFTSQ
jgi:hypothetical protein